MNIVEITPDYTVAPQICVQDVKTIADLGFRSIMCNRPDAESPDQTDVELIRAETLRLGLEFAFVPVISGGITSANVVDFRSTLEKLPAPVLAYCRSGARCQNLWQIAQN